MATVFVSYSHKDERYREELGKHLALLERQGLIDAWHDRRIGPGDHVDHSIAAWIDAADIVLVLVSADFLSSTYCQDVELVRAMERHDEGAAKLVPIIVRPCDWHSAPFGRLNALPRDGVPISEFPNPDVAFKQVALAIRSLAAGERSAPAIARSTDRGARSRVTSGNTGRNGEDDAFAIKREFTDLEKDEFLDAAFEEMAAFFDNGLTKLKRTNSHIDVRFKRVDATRFTSVVYVDGKAGAQGSVRLGKNGFGEIAFSNSAHADSNSINESFLVNSDGFSLALKPLGIASFGSTPDRMSMQEAAKYLWEVFVRPLRY